MLKKTITGIAALSLILSIPTAARADTPASRVAGANRYDTSLAVARQYFPKTSSVFIATGKNFPDALAAGPLAATRKAPILLFGDQITPGQATYLGSLQKPQITILGGASAISTDVETQLAQYGTVERINGTDRYDTAAKIAGKFGKTSKIYLATGTSFADALAGGVLAAREAAPMMLTAPGSGQPAVNIAARLGATETIVLGGPGAVPDTALAGLPAPRRVYGANRYETAASIFQVKPAQSAFLASGVNFPDALAVVPAAGITQQPLLLATQSCSPTPPPVPVTMVGGVAALADSASAQCPVASSEVAAALATLQVKGRAPKTGYNRQVVFGQSWADTDRNGCDTRNDILGRDLVNKTYGNGCVVLSGVLNDPYSGRQIIFTRGQDTSKVVQIDHVVALSDAWQKGAQQLSQDQRVALANDPLNLLAVDGLLNQQKSDSDAASWLPPNKNYRCAYVSRQVAVKKKYNLWVTQAERDAIVRVLSSCVGLKLPTDADARRVLEAPKPPQQSSQPVPNRPQQSRQPAPQQRGGGFSGWDCPANAPIKGNANSGIYHVPGGRYYSRTKPEKCFASESEARNAGYRKARR